MSLSEATAVSTVPNGRQVVGRFGGVTEGQYPKIRVITGRGAGSDGQDRDFYEEVDPPQRYNPTLIQAIEALREGQLVSLGLHSHPKTFHYKKDGAAGGRTWSKGDAGVMVVDEVRSVTVLSD